MSNLAIPIPISPIDKMPTVARGAIFDYVTVSYCKIDFVIKQEVEVVLSDAEEIEVTSLIYNPKVTNT
jgi:hypothetical protein